ncbi:MAG: rhomboid family intramembrane serine protease [Bacteroidetes bacterium]|jgi:membrane associated rhomboid family serine protease|nr:rhomboid family intramembrane serine protease [Bacteroidota bacterium]
MTQFRPSRFQTLPTVVKNLIIVNVLVLIAQHFVANKFFNFEDTFALHSWQSEFFKPWQLVTHMFMHSTESIGHIFSNMLALYFFGSVLENVWGAKRFFIFYIVCGLGAALCHLTALYFENQAMLSALQNAVDAESLQHFVNKYGSRIQVSGSYTANDISAILINGATLGASGAVFGCLAAFGYLFPNTDIYLYFFIPLKAKWFVLLYAGFEIAMTVRNSAGDNVAHIAHLGGALVGFILVYYWNRSNRKHFY